MSAMRDGDIRDAIEVLAERLRSGAEHLDPTDNWEMEWRELPERECEFYRLCIKAVLAERAAIEVVLAAAETAGGADRDNQEG
jgi:hypothetical protein